MGIRDFELRVLADAEALDLGGYLSYATGPQNVTGIELNSYAAELARLTVWIGDIQWSMKHHGGTRNPILSSLETIECRDAILRARPELSPFPNPPPASGASAQVLYSTCRSPSAPTSLGQPHQARLRQLRSFPLALSGPLPRQLAFGGDPRNFRKSASSQRLSFIRQLKPRCVAVDAGTD